MYGELDEILIKKKTELSDIDEPLVLWAHDDTVEQNSEYRYRIRLGVFNPIGGTNQFVKEDMEFKGKVILWSDFSEVTEPVKIPSVLYFFPLQEVAEVVTVQISRYAMGYW